jgi:hypothetical protein
MNSPNLQQRLYLAKALNENTDTLFDHPEMNEAVTRKHFQQVADLIKAHPDAKKRAELAAHHAEIFKKQNPRFDHERFFKAANAEKPMNEEEMEVTQLDELSLVKKALVKVRKSMRGDGVVGTAALAASNVAPNLWGGVSDADNEHGRKYGAKMRLRRKGKTFGKVQEATRSKYLKVYGKHKVGSDESKMNLARLKRDIAVLRRGGADAETLKGAAASRGRYDRNEKPDPSYNPHDAAMAGYRFANMASRSKAAGKKSPRKVNEATRSKRDKAYRKFGHGSEYSLADLKRQVAALRRGGASDEIIKNYPAIHARGGYHDKAEITTARGNFMARGMRKRDQGIKSPRK